MFDAAQRQHTALPLFEKRHLRVSPHRVTNLFREVTHNLPISLYSFITTPFMRLIIRRGPLNWLIGSWWTLVNFHVQFGADELNFGWFLDFVIAIELVESWKLVEWVQIGQYLGWFWLEFGKLSPKLGWQWSNWTIFGGICQIVHEIGLRMLKTTKNWAEMVDFDTFLARFNKDSSPNWANRRFWCPNCTKFGILPNLEA